jgi:hypothetical protein
VLITSILTISSFSCSNLFIDGGHKHSNEKTGTTGPTGGQTGGDKHSNKKTETTGTTDGKARGHKPCPVLPSVVPVVSVFFMVCLSPPILPSVFPVVLVFFMVCSPNEKITIREVTDGQTGGDKPPIKRLKQEKLLMVKLVVISTA